MESQPAPTAPPTGRQWFRLASLARMQTTGQDLPPLVPAPAPPVVPPTPAPIPTPAPVLAPAPAPAPTPPQPNQTVVPRVQPQPQPHQQSTPHSQQALPPITTNGAPSVNRRQVTPPPVPADFSQPPPGSRVHSRAPTPPESPRVIKQSSPTPPKSPKIQQLQPIKAPTPFPEPEPKPLRSPSPKSMLMPPGNSNGGVKPIVNINPKPLLNDSHSHIDARAPSPSPKIETTHNQTGMATAMKNKDDDGEMKIITMAGENTGVYMELGSAHRHHVNRKQQHGHQLQHQTNGSEQQSEDGKSEDKKKGKAKKPAAEGKPITALVNSNVQGVNNSILLKNSCTQQSPGINLTLVSQRQPKHKDSTH